MSTVRLHRQAAARAGPIGDDTVVYRIEFHVA